MRDLPAVYVAADRARRSGCTRVSRRAIDADTAERQGRNPEDPRPLVWLSDRHPRDPRHGDLAPRLSLTAAATKPIGLAGFFSNQENTGNRITQILHIPAQGKRLP